jgi:hypothetical protein
MAPSGQGRSRGNTALGLVPPAGGRGRIVTGGTIRAVGHPWHPVLAIPAAAMGRASWA